MSKWIWICNLSLEYQNQKFVLWNNLCNNCSFLKIRNLISPFSQTLLALLSPYFLKAISLSVNFIVTKSNLELQIFARGKYENKHLRNMVEHVCNTIKSKMHSCPPLKLVNFQLFWEGSRNRTEILLHILLFMGYPWILRLLYLGLWKSLLFNCYFELLGVNTLL